MMADDTNGPMKDDVLPIMEKRAKKRNWALVLGKVMVHIWQGGGVGGGGLALSGERSAGWR